MPRHPGVRLEWRGPGRDVQRITDARKPTVVMRNLVRNALKFTERGLLRAAATFREGAVVLRVADTGIRIGRWCSRSPVWLSVTVPSPLSTKRPFRGMSALRKVPRVGENRAEAGSLRESKTYRTIPGKPSRA